jgi:hypothetical protein
MSEGNARRGIFACRPILRAENVNASLKVLPGRAWIRDRLEVVGSNRLIPSR